MAELADVVIELDPGALILPALPVPADATPAATPPDRADAEARGWIERMLVMVRLGAAVFALAQIVSYSVETYPPGARSRGLALAAVLVAADLVVWRALVSTGRAAAPRALSLLTLVLDGSVVVAFVWIFSFDRLSAHWALLYLVPVTAAVRFQLAGALAGWAAMAAFYVTRESWAASHWGEPSSPESIAFRMGIGLILALVVGLTARDLTRQRARTAAALAELDRVDRVRQHLIWTLAHDLRNPLTALRGAVQTLTARGRTLPPAQVTSMLAVADRQAARIQCLTRDLLDLARLERGQLDLALREVNLRDAVGTALGFIDPAGEVHNGVAPEFWVRADPARLEQVVVNLVENALRHGRPPVRVDAAREGRAVRLAVVDAGPGVPPERVAALFDPFAGDGPDSVGLGLWVVRSLAEAQGGRACYEPAEGGGRFVVELPAVGGLTSASRAS